MEIVKESLAKGRGITYTFYDKSSLAPTTQLQVADGVPADRQRRPAHDARRRDIDAAAESGEYLGLRQPGPGPRRCRHRRPPLP